MLGASERATLPHQGPRSCTKASPQTATARPFCRACSSRRRFSFTTDPETAYSFSNDSFIPKLSRVRTAISDTVFTLRQAAASMRLATVAGNRSTLTSSRASFPKQLLWLPYPVKRIENRRRIALPVKGLVAKFFRARFVRELRSTEPVSRATKDRHSGACNLNS